MFVTLGIRSACTLDRLLRYANRCVFDWGVGFQKVKQCAKHPVVVLTFSPIHLDLCSRVDTPTERRVRRWCISLRELLRDATGRHEFEMFLKKEYSQENIRFWQACEQLKYAPQSSVPEQVHEIYR